MVALINGDLGGCVYRSRVKDCCMILRGRLTTRYHEHNISGKNDEVS